MKILVVEDNKKIAEILGVYLTRENFLVEKANNGDLAFNMAKDGNYDLIVLDLMLPRRSGFNIISTLRALNIKTPILVISARDSLKDRIKALDLGADDYLVKNFAVEELSARAKTLIRRESGVTNNLFKCKNLSIDLTNMVVRRNGKVLKLTRTEFKLLEILMRKKNKVLLVENLSQKTWGKSPEDIPSNKLNVHLRMLRRKVDEPFGMNLIRTVRGFGYMITDLD